MKVEELTRSQIRYALMRCKTGNPEPEHRQVLEYFQPALDKAGETIYNFQETWDIDKDEIRIAKGAKVLLFKEEAEKSLFDEDGNLIQ